MDKYLIFANYLSLLPLVFAVFICVYYLLSHINLVPSVFTESYLLGYFISIFLAQLIKYIIYPFFDFAKRPQGAKGCDYNSQKGDCSGKPGCPSGHMSTTAFFVVFNILILTKTNYIKSDINRRIFMSLNIILLILMGWARYYKLCHSILQIVLGSILGALLALFFFK